MTQIKLSQVITIAIIAAVLSGFVSWKASEYTADVTRLRSEHRDLTRDNLDLQHKNEELNRELEKCKASVPSWRPGTPIGTPAGSPVGSPQK